MDIPLISMFSEADAIAAEAVDVMDIPLMSIVDDGILMLIDDILLISIVISLVCVLDSLVVW